jgi:ankyrin repeat protein
MSTSPQKGKDNPLEELLALLRLMQSPAPNTRVCKTLTGAVSDGNIELAKKFLAAGSDVNESTMMGSPVSTAARIGNLELVNLLLKEGAKDIHGAVVGAAWKGKIDVLRRLFGEPVDLETAGPEALKKAAYDNQAEAVKLLLEKGARMDANDYYAVGEAARNAAIDVLKVFFAAGLKPENAGDALRKAASGSLCFVAVKFLVDAGVDPVNHPHYMQSLWGDKKILEKPLLPADAAEQVNKKEVADFLRGNPIDVEAILAREAARRKALEPPADLESLLRQEREKKTAHLLRGPARIEALQRAISLIQDTRIKPHLNEVGTEGHTALGLAANNGDTDIVKALLEAGADPNRGDGEKETPPIYHAARNSDPRMVEVLLKAGADPDRKNKLGFAALVAAADHDSLEIVRMLLEAGSDPKITEDQSGQTAMNVEHGLNGAAIKALLREAVKKRQAGKPEKGQGLSFLARKKGFNAATVRGVKDFQKFYYGGHPEWSVAFVHGPIEDVSKAYSEIMKAARRETDVAKKKISSASKFVHLLQLKGSAWTILLSALGFYETIKNEAQALTKQLKTRVFTYAAEDTSGAEGYELFENGELLESAFKADEFQFESKRRSQPQFDEKTFPDSVFAEEGIYLPACYPEDDGFDVKLVLKGLSPEDVIRADFVALKN